MPVLRAPFICLISPSPFSSSSSHLDPIGGFETRDPHPTLLFGKVTESGSYGSSRRLGLEMGTEIRSPAGPGEIRKSDTHALQRPLDTMDLLARQN